MSHPAQPVWRLKKNIAEARAGEWKMSVDVRQPDWGVRLDKTFGTKWGQVLGTPKVIVGATESLDPFARAGNLITAYPCTDERIFGGEVSYRVGRFPDFDSLEQELESDAGLEEEDNLPFAETVTLELVYSIQTLLLDTQPQPEVTSRLVGESIGFYARAGAGLKPVDSPHQALACLIRNGDDQMLLTVMPSDFHSLSVKTQREAEHPNTYEIRWELPAEFLEKGVIRRFRAFSAYGPDQALLLAAAQAFYHSEVPLTA